MNIISIVSAWHIQAITKEAPYFSPIKSILFDLGGVLIKPDEKEIIVYLAKFFGVSEKTIQDLHVNELQWIRINDQEFVFWQNYAKKVEKDLPLNWREEYAAVKFAAVKELPGIRMLLEDLRQEGYQLDMLSNFEPWMEPLLDKFGYRDLFSHIHLSYKTKLEKPSHDAYQNVLNDTCLQPKEVLFIDDQFKNITGARDLGIDAIHFNNADQLRQEFVKKHILKK